MHITVAYTALRCKEGKPLFVSGCAVSMIKVHQRTRCAAFEWHYAAFNNSYMRFYILRRLPFFCRSRVQQLDVKPEPSELSRPE